MPPPSPSEPTPAAVPRVPVQDPPGRALDDRTALDAVPPAEQARFLAAVLAHLTDAVVACDAEGRLTLFNPAARALHGLPPEQVPPEELARHYDLYDADGVSPLQPEQIPLLRALRGEVVRDVEIVVAPRHSPRRTLLCSGQLVRGADGARLGAVVAMHDVTAQRAAELLRVEQVAAEQRRQVSEAGLTRLQRLNAAALAVNGEQTVEGVLQAITEQAALVIGAEQAVASLTRGDDWAQAITAAVLGERYRAWRDYEGTTDGTGIYALVCETSVPVRLTQAELEAHPRWRGFGAHAPEHPPMRGWLAAPLVRRDGSNLGLVQLSDKQGPGAPEFDAQDEASLVQLARLASLALEKAVEFEREHEVAVELQRSLLPQGLPDVAGLQVQSAYVPGRGEADLAVGGDFYDLFELDDGHVGLALGDVVGHGLRSASLMGQVRSALRGIAVEQADPARVVAALDRLVATLGDGAMATLAYGVLHVPTGALQLVLAGHPPPLLRSGDGTVRALAAEPGLPVGALPGGGYRAEQHLVAPGDTLVLYSDGLVEHRGRGVEEGIAELAAALAQAPDDLPALTADVVARLTGGTNDDDVAVLALRRPAA